MGDTRGELKAVTYAGNWCTGAYQRGMQGLPDTHTNPWPSAVAGCEAGHKPVIKGLSRLVVTADKLLCQGACRPREDLSRHS